MLAIMSKIKGQYVLELGPETDVEMEIIEKLKIKNGFSDGSGILPENEASHYWGDIEYAGFTTSGRKFWFGKEIKVEEPKDEKPLNDEPSEEDGSE